MNRIRIGQLGIGHNHAEGKMNSVRSLPEVFEVIGYAEPDPDWIESRGDLEAYQGLRRMEPEELLRTPNLDAVLVECDVWNLDSTAQKCIEAGFHIHMDKPAGEDIGLFETMLRDAERSERIVQLGYMYRYNPAIRQCIDAVHSGTLGEVYAVDSAMSTEHSPEYRQWLTHFAGGTMYIFGCHLIDLIVRMLGQPDRVVPFQKATGRDGVHAIDNGLAILEYPRCTAAVRINSTEVNGYGRRQLVVCGSEGTIEIKPMEKPTMMTVTTREYSEPYADSGRTEEVPTNGERYDEMMLDFARMVRGEIRNPYTYQYELLVQKTTLKACGFDIEW